MVKKVSKIQKEKILEDFLNGKKIKDISTEFDFSISTITRQLKNLVGADKFLQIKEREKNNNENNISENNLNRDSAKYLSNNIIENSEDNLINDSIFPIDNNFFEIAPLTDGVELEMQRDITSIPLNDVEFPKMLYMLVNEKTELEVKLLKDFPEWQFLPQEDLDRRTIQIFYDIKIAKRLCNKKQKVIKIPNTNVFSIVAPILLNRGITRIVSEEKLIAL